LIGSRLKNRILVPDRGGAELQTAGNLLVVEDLKRGANKDMGPKDIFETVSKDYLQKADNHLVGSWRGIVKQLRKGFK